MVATRMIGGALSTAVFFLTVLSDARGAQVEYSESLQQLEVHSGARLSRAVNRLEDNGSVESISFNAFGRHFDLRLGPNQNILSPLVRKNLSDGIGVFRGSIDGVSGSWARIVVANDVPRGLIWDGTSMYAIEPAIDAAKTPQIFRLDDLGIAPGTLTCAHVDGPETGTDLLTAVVSDVAPSVERAAGAVSSVDLAVIADSTFLSAKGNDAEAEIVTRINNVDGIFSAQLGVQINLARTDVFDSADDPFSDQSDGGLLLDELSAYRSSTPAQNQNGLSHLLTSRELAGPTVGVAYGSGICSRGFGAGLTQATFSVTTDSLIIAHEIGHNFGAPHDGTSSACANTPQDFLMAPQLNGSDQFSACSITQMQDDIDRASCITQLPTVDVSVVVNQAGSILLTDSTNVSFIINNVGTEDASGVNYEVSIPTNVNLDGITSTSGSCSSGGGLATCSIGSISAGSSATVELSVTSTIPGSADFAATVTATGDTSAGNDQATASLIIEPAVDLVATAVESSVVLDGGTTAQVEVDNRASIAATSASVTITAESGIRIDSANWAVGSCSILANSVTCVAASLAAQSDNTISINLTGLSEGTHSFAVNALADETDLNVGNNAATAQVTVMQPPAESGGGGAFGMLHIFGVIVLLRFRKRRVSGRCCHM